ncbi:lysophospholipid acyltransferase family protein [Thermocoleostomius sinensis]|uniref:1-acyl-sn-glycerol-3-phosphate acyltransferase n=1 Tax=Thermocoleostomius sinensis A174 TaxID=2016057 RepID=A0A9E8ZCR5_9CYAN|nr:1-acyl-sn-glycerol-3-phosphate acyltransferase [Thermocoleostomius sinensis]WAL60864.1 1-acyl-sn-glycerol-3-phosphate acyltransferase [Thermocoleostomius sinensis A174]
MVLLNPLSNPLKTIVSSPNTHSINSRFSPWLTPAVYALGCWVVLPTYFRIQVSGQENLPGDGPVILAPTHRSRWDALLVPYAAGRFVTGRDIHFMVTADEVKGFQGWLIRQLGGFPVNPRQPAIASLRHGVEVLQNRQMMVIFPEGGIFRDKQLHPLKPGLARLALQAEASQPGLGVKIVPMHLDYDQPMPSFGSQVHISIGQPIEVAHYQEGSIKQKAQQLTNDLSHALQVLIQEDCQLEREGEFRLHQNSELSPSDS